MAKAPNPRIALKKRIKELSVPAAESTIIKQEYYDQYDCKRGLRDINGKGVLVGLTEISEIIAAKEDENGVRIPVDGELYYRGSIPLKVQTPIISIRKKQQISILGQLFSQAIPTLILRPTQILPPV